MNKISFGIMIFFLILSCNNVSNKNDRIEKSSYIKSEIEHNKLLALAINKGDFKAYNKVSNDFLLEERGTEIYYYSLIMANKYKCPEAYYHLFAILNDNVLINNTKQYSSDETTKNMALYYLLKSYELGYDESKYKITEIFGKKTVVPNSTFYLKELIKKQE